MSKFDTTVLYGALYSCCMAKPPLLRLGPAPPPVIDLMGAEHFLLITNMATVSDTDTNGNATHV